MSQQVTSKRFVRVARAAQKLDVSVPTIYRYSRSVPGFPKIIKLTAGGRTSALDEDELDAYMVSRQGDKQ